MRKTEGLWIGLFLLGFTNRGQLDEQQFLFSDGIQLVVEGTSNSTAPRLLVFVPAGPGKTPQNVTLVCLARGLFSGLVEITWRINDTAVTAADGVAEAIREPDGSYTAVGFLVIETAEWSLRNVYRCAVIQGSKVYEGTAQASCFSDTS